MKVTPRATEVKAIVELLESTEFDSDTALAKAILKRTGELFAEREWHAWVYRESPDALYLTWGPFSSDNEAKRFAGKYVDMLKGQHMILPMSSTAELTARMATYKVPSHYCTTCTHSLISHEHPKKTPKCAVRGCKCKRSTTE